LRNFSSGIRASKNGGKGMGKDKKTCLLKKMENGEQVKLKRGSELELITKEGAKFKGILCDFSEGRLHTVISLGILLIVPLHALSSLHLV